MRSFSGQRKAGRDRGACLAGGWFLPLCFAAVDFHKSYKIEGCGLNYSEKDRPCEERRFTQALAENVEKRSANADKIQRIKRKGSGKMGLRRDMMLFPEGREKALTFSYDDAVTQDVRLIEMMNRYGVKGTFNINTGRLGMKSLHEQNGKTVTHNKLYPEEIAETYAGHELAVHGLTHLDLARVPSGTAAYEVSADRRNIETITKTPVRGMAYPFGTYTEETLEILKSCGIVYSRTVQSTHSFRLPEDFLRWHPTCHHADERLMKLAEHFVNDETQYDEAMLFYVWGHSYEFDVTDGWDAMEAFLEYVSGKEDIWYASNMDIYEYVTAFRRLVYTADGSIVYNPSVLTVWLAVDGRTYEIEAGKNVRIV